MPDSDGGVVRYRRNRFSTRLPAGSLYTRSHFWLREADPGRWLVGLTGFATRMLGDIVEFDFETTAGARVEIADVIGWIEGFKAVSDLYCVAAGEFAGGNAEALESPETIAASPYGRGWLYAVRGTPDPDALDVEGYAAHLDATIDAMLERPWKSPEVGGS